MYGFTRRNTIQLVHKTQNPSAKLQQFFYIRKRERVKNDEF